MKQIGLVFAILVAMAAGCGDDDACYPVDDQEVAICDRLVAACAPASGQLPALSEMVQVVPDQGMPAGVVSQDSHNNLDVIWYQNRIFFAFRTAPSHFASDETVLYLVSSVDQQSWSLEASFHLNTDLREPRFLSFDGRLFLYFAVLGYQPTAFEPQYAMVTEYLGPCGWSDPEQLRVGGSELPGFIPWRTKTIDGVPYLVGYVGGENIYEEDGEPIQVYWLTTADGRDFTPVVPDHPVVIEGGSSETDFVFTDDGGVIAVARNEAGDALGWGMNICRAEPGALGDWSCVNDPKKYDSPLLFRHGAAIYLIGRRNVTETGDYDLGLRDLSAAEQSSRYELDYWSKPKRCSLWRVDPDSLSVELVLDLPSNGDTCFPGLVPLGGDQYLIYNYTSPLDDPDMKWVTGQTNPTFIYRLTLTLPPA